MPKKKTIIDFDPKLVKRLKRQVAGIARRKEVMDPRFAMVRRLAVKRLVLERGENPDEWCLLYRTRHKSTIGILPAVLPLPVGTKERLKHLRPELVYVQIRAALTTFALEVLNDKRFVPKQKA